MGKKKQIVQFVWKKILKKKKKKRRKTHVLHENIQAAHISSSKEKIPKLKCNKGRNIWGWPNMKIIPACPPASLPRFHQMALQDCSIAM